MPGCQSGTHAKYELFELKQADVIPYYKMCHEEGVNLQRGMNYKLRTGRNVILMSVREGAPYADRVEDDGKTLIYEGHDIPKRKGGPDPKSVDQQSRTQHGAITQNGRFASAAERYKKNGGSPDLVRVYEKIRSGIWVFNGVFGLTDYWLERSGGRKVFKFKLELSQNEKPQGQDSRDIGHTRLIPTEVKLKVWDRDRGKCTDCGASDNLHFDHIIPFSKGGSSLVAENIQLLCARHNLSKSDKIQ